ncbi:MAG: exosome complex exonuclease Rrp41, partial [Candidatus Lokiarchaeia archaeon]|nr:exosome complex exonuclease Rrp41 [Candidatus Lokiarchaeia archaeon]
AVAVGKINGKKVVDLSGIEDKAGEADLPIAITWYNDEVSLLQFDGDMDLDEMIEFLDLAKIALEKIHQIQLNALKSKYIKLQEETTKEKEVNKGDK